MFAFLEINEIEEIKNTMDENESMIKINDVTKKFKGLTALSNVNLEYQKGMIHGIIGRNGSGKTVLMKCILGLMTPTEGTIIVNGHKTGDCINDIVRTGAIIENPGFIMSYSGINNMKYFAKISGLSISPNELDSLFEMIDLSDYKNKKVKTYSLGMIQRLGIAQVFLNDPELIVLDEPMNSLDRKMVLRVKDILRNARDQGKTILLSSHIMEDIMDLCDTVTELDGGTVSGFKRV